MNLERLREILSARLGLSAAALADDWLVRAMNGLRGALSLSDAALFAALETEPLASPVWQAAVDAVTVHETHFLRHKEWFEEFERRALVPLIEERRLRGPRRLRLWSAGCSTGEEPYTLAMLIDRLLPQRRGWEIEIVGSDISAATLATARAASYRAWALRELDPADRAKHFAEGEPGRHCLLPAIRDMVRFDLINLTELKADDADEPFDVIFCRNVLMYWAPDVQRRVAAALAKRIAEGGWLVVSPVEAVAEWYRPLRPHNSANAIFFRREAGEEPARRVVPKARRPKAQAKTLPVAPQAKPAAPPPRPAAAAPLAAGHDEDALRRAQALADSGRLQEARAASEAILAADALHGEAYLLLASVCEELGDHAAGFEAARRAVYLAPDSAVAHFRLGALLASMGEAAQARRSFNNVLGLLGERPDEAPATEDAALSVGMLRFAAISYLTAGRRGGSHG